MHGSNGDISKCPMASMFESQPLPKGYTRPTELLTNGKTQVPTFLPKTYSVGCTDNMCHGSHMLKTDEVRGGLETESAQIWDEAHDYIREFYHENKLSEADCVARLDQVKNDIFTKGYYEHTYDELSFGVKTCWRNARKCIMRSQWNTMTTIDARHITTGEEMMEACFNHLKVTRNGGRIRPHVTVFPQKKPGKSGPRIWNEQLCRYAGYRMEDGTIIGDPTNLELTARAIELGWTPKYGKWDVCPIIVCEEGGDPICKDIPADCVKEVMIEHPTYEWFKDLGLRWFDHPPVSSFALSIGGIDYTAAPFSGWFMSTEIAARDLADEYRYNALPDIARHLNLPMSNRALWKDRAVLELSHAVLYSWDKAKTTMVDQHSASDSFIAWYDKEMKTRGHCPADWVWIVPPTSSATTKVFHQEMFSYVVKPGVVELPERPWYTYWREKGITPVEKIPRWESAGTASDSDIVIAYGTETGNSLRYAEKLQKHFNARKLPVAPTLVELDDLKLEDIKTTLIIITSSYGDGEPPANAHEFAKVLGDEGTKFNARYAVFGMGSRLYGDTYQGFPRFVDSSLKGLGGRRVIGVGAADETSADPDAAFEQWMISLGVAIEVGSETDVAIEEDPKALVIADVKQSIQQFSHFVHTGVTGGRAFFDYKVEAEQEPRAAYNVELTTTSGESFKYEEGDHVQVLPPTKMADLEQAQSFIAKWGEKIVHGVAVSRILSEFVEWTYGEHVAAKIIEEHQEISEEELEEVIFSLPYKKARTFSIASTPIVRPSTLHLAVARIDGGHTSVPMIDSLRSRNTQLISACVHKSKFRMPESASTPIILVGTGTGVGPLRGMMHGRLTADTKGGQRGSITCILGYRTPKEVLYRDEFQEASLRGVDVWNAFSRDSEGKKEYVGDVILRESNKIVHLLEQGANFYVCGSTPMGKSVEVALAKALEKTLGLDAVASKAYVGNLRKSSRMFVDTYTRTGAN